jgi:hypothetical protein
MGNGRVWFVMDEVTKTISQYWRQKNARRNGLTTEKQATAIVAAH